MDPRRAGLRRGRGRAMVRTIVEEGRVQATSISARTSSASAPWSPTGPRRRPPRGAACQPAASCSSRGHSRIPGPAPGARLPPAAASPSRTERDGRAGGRRPAQLRRGQRRLDGTVRTRQPVGQRLHLRRPARARRRDARRRDRAADPAPGQPGAHTAGCRRLCGGARRGPLRRGDVEPSGRDHGAGRPDPARPHAAGVLGRSSSGGRPVRPDAAGDAAGARHAALRRHTAPDRTGGARPGGRGGNRNAHRHAASSRGRVLRGPAERVARHQGRARPAGRARGRTRAAGGHGTAGSRGGSTCGSRRPTCGSRRPTGGGSRVRGVLGGRGAAGGTLVSVRARIDERRPEARRDSIWRHSPGRGTGSVR